MIEDALGLARNLHRLIISASAITLLFSLSLRSPQTVVDQHKSLDHFLRFNFDAYEVFKTQRVSDVAQPWAQSAVSDVRTAIKDLKFLGFGEEQIAVALEKPLLLGEFKLRETKLRVPGEFTLKQLETLAQVYPLGADLRVGVPNLSTFRDQLLGFLSEHKRPGASVQNVRVDTSETFVGSEAPEEGRSIKVILSFEIIPSGGGAAPVFQGLFDAEVRTVTGTAFLKWLSDQSGAKPFAEVTSGTITWLPLLASLPREQAEKKLSEVFVAVSDELKQGTPEKKSASLLGTEIPGVLLVYAAPLLLMGLVYHFIFHLDHLSRFVADHRATYDRFPWPLFSRERRWQWEVPVTMLILPVGATMVLALQLWRFRFLEVIPAVFLAVAVIVLIKCGRHAIHRLNALRCEIANASRDFEI